jgi:hypothetical protein
MGVASPLFTRKIEPSVSLLVRQVRGQMTPAYVTAPPAPPAAPKSAPATRPPAAATVTTAEVR